MPSKHRLCCIFYAIFTCVYAQEIINENGIRGKLSTHFSARNCTAIDLFDFVNVCEELLSRPRVTASFWRRLHKTRNGSLTPVQVIQEKQTHVKRALRFAAHPDSRAATVRPGRPWCKSSNKQNNSKPSYNHVQIDFVLYFIPYHDKHISWNEFWMP